MLEQARQRTAAFQTRLKDAGIDVAVITDESSIGYLAGFWGYLSVEFGRPTFLIVRPDCLTVSRTSRVLFHRHKYRWRDRTHPSMPK